MKKSLIAAGIAAIGVISFAAHLYWGMEEPETLDERITETIKTGSNSLATNKIVEEKLPLPSTLNLSISDVWTGIAVIPDFVEAIQRENKEIAYRFSEKEIAENGTLLIPLENGTYDITVEAVGYQKMASFFSFNNNSLNVNFNMEPLEPRPELSLTYLEKVHRDDAMVILGFIVDDHSGRPLEGVLISSEDKKAKAKSKKNGFFQIILPLPDNQSEIKKRGTLYFDNEGYITEVRSNFDIFKKGDIGLKIRMYKGNGINSEKILNHREADIQLK